MVYADTRSIKGFLPYMKKDRTFGEYVNDLRPYHIDVVSPIIHRALNQPEVNFFDIGCGYGNASTDFFEVLERAVKRKRLSVNILDNVHFHGVELYVEPQNTTNDERVHFHRTDIRKLADGTLPTIDVAIAYFLFPYLDEKLAALREVYSNLRHDLQGYLPGEAIVTKYHRDQLRGARTGHKRNQSNEFEIDLESVVIGDKGVINIIEIDNRKGHHIGNAIQIIRGNARFTEPHLQRSIDEPAEWSRDGPRGWAAGQKISVYEMQQ